MQLQRLGIRAEIVLNLTILVLVSILLHSYIVLKMTKSNLLELEKSAAEDILQELQIILPTTLQTKSPTVLTPQLVQRFGRFKSVAVLDLENKLVFSSDTSVSPFTAGTPVDNTDAAAFEKIIVREELQKHLFGMRKVAGVKFFVPLKNQDTPWGWLIAELNLERLEQSFSRTKMPILLYTAIYSILMAVFAYFVLSKIIIAPIQEIMRVADRIAAGHFDERIAPAEGEESRPRHDELGRLREAINTMTNKLLQHQQQLRSHVDELTSLNQQLSVAQAEIVQREKLAAVGRLAAGLAHEIGNPLGAVLGYIEILKKPDEYEESRGLLLRIEKELLRIHNIMQELLGFVRPKQIEVGLIDPVALINETVRETLDPQLLQNVQVDYAELATPPLWIRMDRGQLQQIMLNLLVNACQAMQSMSPKQSVQRLKLSVTAYKNEQKQDVIAIGVTDNGPGIAPENLRKIFEPFFTTKEPGQGTGLGLYIAGSMLQIWGGELLVDSRVGQGSTFTILLPKP